MTISGMAKLTKRPVSNAARHLHYTVLLVNTVSYPAFIAMGVAHTWTELSVYNYLAGDAGGICPPTLPLAFVQPPAEQNIAQVTLASL